MEKCWKSVLPPLSPVKSELIWHRLNVFIFAIQMPKWPLGQLCGSVITPLRQNSPFFLVWISLTPQNFFIYKCSSQIIHSQYLFEFLTFFSHSTVPISFAKNWQIFCYGIYYHRTGMCFSDFIKVFALLPYSLPPFKDSSAFRLQRNSMFPLS